MKSLEVRLSYRNSEGSVLLSDVIEADTLLELTAQLLLIIARVAKEMETERIKRETRDDDIPF